MENNNIEKFDIEKAKELFEYEMTGVVLNLKGEFAAISGEKTRYNDAAVSSDKLIVNTVSLPIVEQNSIKTAVPQTTLSEFSGIKNSEFVNIPKLDIPNISINICCNSVSKNPNMSTSDSVDGCGAKLSDSSIKSLCNGFDDTSKLLNCHPISIKSISVQPKKIPVPGVPDALAKSSVKKINFDLGSSDMFQRVNMPELSRYKKPDLKVNKNHIAVLPGVGYPAKVASPRCAFNLFPVHYNVRQIKFPSSLKPQCNFEMKKMTRIKGGWVDPVVYEKKIKISSLPIEKKNLSSFSFLHKMPKMFDASNVIVKTNCAPVQSPSDIQIHIPQFKAAWDKISIKPTDMNTAASYSNPLPAIKRAETRISQTVNYFSYIEDILISFGISK